MLKVASPRAAVGTGGLAKYWVPGERGPARLPNPTGQRGEWVDWQVPWREEESFDRAGVFFPIESLVTALCAATAAWRGSSSKGKTVDGKKTSHATDRAVKVIVAKPGVEVRRRNALSMG